MLQHRVELQLVPRPRLVRRHRPCHRVKGEVVVLVRRAARRRRNIQRQHKLALLPGVVQHRRRRPCAALAAAPSPPRVASRMIAGRSGSVTMPFATMMSSIAFSRAW